MAGFPRNLSTWEADRRFTSSRPGLLHNKQGQRKEPPSLPLSHLSEQLQHFVYQVRRYVQRNIKLILISQDRNSLMKGDGATQFCAPPTSTFNKEMLLPTSHPYAAGNSCTRYVFLSPCTCKVQDDFPFSLNNNEVGQRERV